MGPKYSLVTYTSKTSALIDQSAGLFVWQLKAELKHAYNYNYNTIKQLH